MRIVKKRGIQILFRKPEEEEPRGTMIEKSLFERNRVGGFDCFC